MGYYNKTPEFYGRSSFNFRFQATPRAIFDDSIIEMHDIRPYISELYQLLIKLEQYQIIDGYDSAFFSDYRDIVNEMVSIMYNAATSVKEIEFLKPMKQEKIITTLENNFLGLNRLHFTNESFNSIIQRLDKIRKEVFLLSQQ